MPRHRPRARRRRARRRSKEDRSMAVIRWSSNDPFRELASLQERLNRAFEESFARAPRGDEELSTSTWTPPVDIFETGDRLVLKAELPGFREDQIHLRFDD